MKKITGMVLVWFCMVGLSWGGTLGDVNGDGTVGLPEAIHALQVTSGIRSQALVQDAYDFTEYFPVAGGNYLYRITLVGGATTGPTALQIQTSTETLSGKTYLVLNSLTTQTGITSSSKNYYLVGNSETALAGYQSSSPTPATTWMSPAVVIGSKNMVKGDVFCNFFSRTDPANPTMTTGLHYEEYAFVGIEDVSVPAGVFTNCLKILNRTSGGVNLRYYAKNVGMVKRVFSNNSSTPSGYVQELLNNLTVNCTGQGTWNDPDYAPAGIIIGRNGQFAFTSYRSQDNKISALLELKDFSGSIVPSSSLTMSMVSSDGANFVPNPDVYGINPPTLIVTVSNGALSGSYTYTSTLTHHGVAGEPVTPDVSVVTLTGTAACSP
jgi:hypothetical protein